MVQFKAPERWTSRANSSDGNKEMGQSRPVQAWCPLSTKGIQNEREKAALARKNARGPRQKAGEKEGHSNFRSYSSAAMSTTKQEPALCTKAPVVGLSSPNREQTMAAALMHMERAMLSLMVLTVAFESRFR